MRTLMCGGAFCSRRARSRSRPWRWGRCRAPLTLGGRRSVISSARGWLEHAALAGGTWRGDSRVGVIWARSPPSGRVARNRLSVVRTRSRVVLYDSGRRLRFGSPGHIAHEGRRDIVLRAVDDGVAGERASAGQLGCVWVCARWLHRLPDSPSAGAPSSSPARPGPGSGSRRLGLPRFASHIPTVASLEYRAARQANSSQRRSPAPQGWLPPGRRLTGAVIAPGRAAKIWLAPRRQPVPCRRCGEQSYVASCSGFRPVLRRPKQTATDRSDRCGSGDRKSQSDRGRQPHQPGRGLSSCGRHCRARRSRQSCAALSVAGRA